MLTGKLSGCRERELCLNIKELPDYFLLNLKKANSPFLSIESRRTFEEVVG